MKGFRHPGECDEGERSWRPAREIHSSGQKPSHRPAADQKEEGKSAENQRWECLPAKVSLLRAGGMLGKVTLPAERAGHSRSARIRIAQKKRRVSQATMQSNMPTPAVITIQPVWANQCCTSAWTRSPEG